MIWEEGEIKGVGEKRSSLNEDSVCRSASHHIVLALNEPSRSIDDSVHASGNEADQSKAALASCSEPYISMPRGNTSHQHLHYFCSRSSKEKKNENQQGVRTVCLSVWVCKKAVWKGVCVLRVMTGRLCTRNWVRLDVRRSLGQLRDCEWLSFESVDVMHVVTF